jgi:hypothetical protein
MIPISINLWSAGNGTLCSSDYGTKKRIHALPKALIDCVLTKSQSTGHGASAHHKFFRRSNGKPRHRDLPNGMMSTNEGSDEIHH